MGEFTHAMRNPIRERDDRIRELESVLKKAREFIAEATLFDTPGTPGLTLAFEVERVLRGRPVAVDEPDEKVRTLHPSNNDHMKCASRDCWLCHGTPPNAGPR